MNNQTSEIATSLVVECGPKNFMLYLRDPWTFQRVYEWAIESRRRGSRMPNIRLSDGVATIVF